MRHILSIIICVISCTVSAVTYEASFVDCGSRNKYLEVSVDGISRLFTFDTGCTGVADYYCNEAKMKEFEKYK